MTQDDLSRLSAQYGDMSDTQLMDIARSYDGLQEEAKTLLREEFSRRSLEPPLIEEGPAELSYSPLTTVAKYRDLSEAIVARSVLEAAGITCFLQDENTIRMEWVWSNLLGGLRLQVGDQDAARAQELLNQPRPESIEFAEEPNFDQPLCPKCGSTEVELHSGPSNATVVGLFVFNIPIPTRSRHPDDEVWHCRNCGCTWLDDDQPNPPVE
jgi:hypothetical protein